MTTYNFTGILGRKAVHGSLQGEVVGWFDFGGLILLTPEGDLRNVQYSSVRILPRDHVTPDATGRL